MCKGWTPHSQPEKRRAVGRIQAKRNFAPLNSLLCAATHMYGNENGRKIGQFSPIFRPNAFAYICFYLHFTKDCTSPGKSPNSRSNTGGDNSGVNSAERSYDKHSSALGIAGNIPPAAQYFARSFAQYADRICADVCSFWRHSLKSSERRKDSAAVGTRTFLNSFLSSFSLEIR